MTDYDDVRDEEALRAAQEAVLIAEWWQRGNEVTGRSPVAVVARQGIVGMLAESLGEVLRIADARAVRLSIPAAQGCSVSRIANRLEPHEATPEEACRCRSCRHVIARRDA